MIWTSGSYWLSFNRVGLSSSTGQILRSNSTDQKSVSVTPSDGPPSSLSNLIVNRVTELVDLFEDDIASVMQKRATLGYGLGVS